MPINEGMTAYLKVKFYHHYEGRDGLFDIIHNLPLGRNS
jgi:hypothetical protein